MPGDTYPAVATVIVAEVNGTCSPVVTKSAVVPARAGGVTPGESLANFAGQSVSSTSVISTEVSPVVGTPGTTRGPMLTTVAAVPGRETGRAVDGISSLVDLQRHFEGSKVEWVPAAGREVEGGEDLPVLSDVSMPSGLLLATVMRDVAVEAVTEVSSGVEVLDAGPIGYFLHGPESSGTL